MADAAPLSGSASDVIVEPPAGAEAPRNNTKPSWRDRKLRVAATAAAVFLIAGGAIYATVDYLAWHEQVAHYDEEVVAGQAQEDASEAAAVGNFNDAAATLAEQVAVASERLAATENQLADNAVRKDLLREIAASTALAEASPTVMVDDLVVVAAIERHSIIAWGSRREQVFTIANDTIPMLSEVEAAQAALATALTALEDSHTAWAESQTP